MGAKGDSVMFCKDGSSRAPGEIRNRHLYFDDDCRYLGIKNNLRRIPIGSRDERAFCDALRLYCEGIVGKDRVREIGWLVLDESRPAADRLRRYHPKSGG